MAWNESGNGNNKNPWDRDNRQDGPPDLDKLVRDLQKKLSGMFGGSGGSGNGAGSEGRSGGDSGAPLVGVLVLILIAWAVTGFYRVDEAERGVVQRFGAYVESTMPGLRWHLPWPIETVDKVNVSQINPFKQTTSMLTSDENIVIVDMVVQYRNTDAQKYLFDVADPIGALADASESAIREVVGKNKLDFILGEGREPIAQQTRDVIQAAMEEYSTGIVVTQVNLQDVNFPAQVEAAVQDAIKAREDKERLGFEAETYANDIVPKARGAAVRQIQEAEAYKERVTADASGEAARFESLLAEYQKAPEVTRERLYIDAIEEVYGNSNKVLLDAEGSGNLLYLPVDQLIKSAGGGAAGSGASQAPRATSQSDRAQRPNREDARSRGTRQ
ncbi:MAG: FtsH protease activity modulator HflK [Gammaproteobacteria bacterium]|nr:FtsH protease activity modulator HflK [Gammaproteobacteria bacterium]NND55276.1 FtsH protease activity modulator HflK [Gammaproteobacteria bacterium]